MKIYQLDLDYFYENIEQNEYYTEVYSSLAKAVEDGKYFLSKRCNDKGFKNYEFKVTEIDLEYAKQFDVKQLNILSKEEYGKYEPTHIVYYFNFNGKLLYKYLRYKDKQRTYLKGFTMYPEDFDKNAGQSFKIGDIVRIKKRNEEEYYSLEYQDYWTEDKLYIVKNQPSRNDGQKYFNNVYRLISNYNGDDCKKGLFVSRYYEKDIELFDGKLAENSPVVFLQKIIKNEIAVTEETWTKLETGQILLDDAGSFRELKEYKDGDTWSCYSNTISKEDTGLSADLIISYGCFYEPIQDNHPKLRIHSTTDYGQDFYVTIEEQPRIIIGRNTTLQEDELQKIYNYITKNLDTLQEYWNSDAKLDGRDLYIKLGLYKEQ